MANLKISQLAPGAPAQSTDLVIIARAGTSLSLTAADLGALATLPAQADSTILANVSGGSAVPAADTLTAILDHIMGSTRGMTLYRGASAWAALAAGTSGQALQTHGTSGDPQWVSQPFDLGFYFEGVLTNAEAVARYVFNRSVTFVANLTGSHASADTASTGTVSFTLKQNGSSVGTVTFTASATGTFTFASPVTFASGDVLQIVAPATADGTLANVAINLAGTR